MLIYKCFQNYKTFASHSKHLSRRIQPIRRSYRTTFLPTRYKTSKHFNQIRKYFVQWKLSLRTMCPCVFIAAVLLLAVTYWYLKKSFNYWKNQNVPFAPDPVLGFGHMLQVITLKENIIMLAERLYKQTDASVIGFYLLHTPGIVVRDPELVKSILQTNFSSFHNSLLLLDKDNDPVLSQNPFFVKDIHQWKAARMRTVSYLSGRKLRILLKFVEDVSSKLNNFVDRKINENGSYECQLKEFFERYTGEFVANSAFAIEGESFCDNPGPKSFTKLAKVLLDPSFINGLKQSLLFYMPRLSKFLKLNFLSKNTDTYFRESIKRMIKERKQKGVNPSDYLQFCLDGTTEDEFNKVIADIIIFYLDAYETSSISLSILFYHLSKNQNVQEKLQKHIASVVEKAGGEITYDALKEMTYLDQVMYESIRLLPPVGVLQKMCTEEITITGSDGMKCHLKPGHAVLIPVSCLHTDKRYFSDPHTFNPERFNPENQSSVHKYAFLPFGEGPRMCPGIRLAQMVVKYGTASLLLKYSIDNSSITKEPLERETNTFLTYYKGGLWGKFKKNQ